MTEILIDPRGDSSATNFADFEYRTAFIATSRKNTSPLARSSSPSMPRLNNEYI